MPGDNLYRLARHYGTTVQALLALNPGIRPYNLQIGSTIAVCPGDGYAETPDMETRQEYRTWTELLVNMRAVWAEHVFWTRLLLVSIAGRLADQSATTERLLRNPYDIARIFAEYYSGGSANQIAALLTEHLKIGAALITALRDGQSAEANDLNRRWYINAGRMADTFADINPAYDREILRQMFFTHLQLTTQEVLARLAGNYRGDIAAMDKVQQEVRTMADYLALGIMKQFPEKF